MIYSFVYSVVLLNGIPGMQYPCKGGVRQGDPLSPLIFVMATYLLQSFNEDEVNNLIQHPLPTGACHDFPIVQYVDDTTFFVMPVCPIQLQHIQNLMLDFAVYTGLRVNYSKSMIVPINVPRNS